jgi:hypothetical protein
MLTLPNGQTPTLCEPAVLQAFYFSAPWEQTGFKGVHRKILGSKLLDPSSRAKPTLLNAA